MRCTVFLVDDEIDLLELYTEMLEMAGYKVVAKARDGQEAVNIFRSLESKPDIIIMDYRMPNKNGLEATEEILKEWNGAQILFSSADESILPIVSRMGLGFLKKPSSYESLLEGIENFLHT